MFNRRMITARYPRKEMLLSNFERRGPRGVLFVETARRLELAEQVFVLVEFPAEKRSFRIRGKVISRRRSCGESRLPPGVEVEFPAEENQTLQLIIDHAEGKQVDFIDRQSPRMPCSLVVSYRRNEDFIREFAEDISEGGTFIRAEQLLPVGTEVDCQLKPPGYLIGIKLRGRISWLRKAGLPQGMGVEFLFKTERQRKKVRDLVKKLLTEQAVKVKQKVKKIRETDRFR